MRIFEQKLCEVIQSLSSKHADKLARPKLIQRDKIFQIISILSLQPEDIVVCNLSKKDLKDGLSSGTWAAIERFIRMNFNWQETVTEKK